MQFRRLVLLLAVSAGAALRSGTPRPERRIAMRPTRRDALRLVPLGLLVAQRANAACSCPTGFKSCVCTDDGENRKDGSASAIGLKRIDAAGRDAADSKMEREMWQAIAEESERPSRRKSEVRPSLNAQRREVASSTFVQEPVMPTQLGLSGGGSQNYGENDPVAAKQRFAAIVQQTVAKREAEYGFKLDADDIKELSGVLRIKYCGPTGLIGPC